MFKPLLAESTPRSTIYRWASVHLGLFWKSFHVDHNRPDNLLWK